MLVLCGDLGGTKTLLQIARFTENQYEVLIQERYISADFNGLLPILNTFLASCERQYSEPLYSACFAIAGPIEKNKANVTNLDWDIDANQIKNELDIGHVRLVNDFYAVASAIELLKEPDYFCLQDPKQAENNRNRAILGAGTGLGTALQIWTGENFQVVATEGGHVDFAPGNKLEIELLQYLMTKNGAVSYENILSGSGLVKIYDFFVAKNKLTNPLSEAMQNNDPAVIISQAALAKQEPLAEQALELFVQIYGRQAGNLALTCLAYGGVYIAGGIAAKIISKLQDGVFIQAFNNNHKMGHLLQKMPVKVIVNPDAGLIGAAYIASKM